VRLCSTSTTVASENGIILMLSTNMDIKSASVCLGWYCQGQCYGPFLLPDGLTAWWYYDFLVTVLPGLLEDVPLAVRERLWFQHSGAPAHYGEDVQQWLNVTYSGRWIGCGGPIAWPPGSQDLTLMDFLCGDTWRSNFTQPVQGLSKIL
jgi:hypothetical protein